ncbi:MAG TPA: hypothetical protein VK779_06185 [Rhizomicrobium sp.]|nr:hypothetical protein [Rhizomicrobium sp.]
MIGHEMVVVLLARGPHQDIGQSHNIFANLNGSWDVEVFDVETDGARRVSAGEWHFAWILEGRAMQDVFVSPARADRKGNVPVKGNRCATTLRIFDSAEENWRVFYFNPVAQSYELLRAQQQGSDIVLEGTDAHGHAIRQAFTDIADNSFRWRREIQKPDGNWQLLAEHSAERR